MNIQSILVNHMTEPLGFLLEHLRIEFTLETDHFEEIQKQLTLSVADQPVYQTEFLPFDNNFFEVDLDLLPRYHDHHPHSRSGMYFLFQLL